MPESVTSRTLLDPSSESLIVLSKIPEHLKIFKPNVEHLKVIKSIVLLAENSFERFQAQITHFATTALVLASRMTSASLGPEEPCKQAFSHQRESRRTLSAKISLGDAANRRLS